MTKREEYESKTEQLILPILEEHGFELVDVEFVKEAGTFYLRAFIDKEGGITINDCEAVSRQLSDLLDEKDFIPDSYILEVSSPGLGRQLKKDKDFARSIGKEVEVKLFQAVDFQKNEEDAGNPVKPQAKPRAAARQSKARSSAQKEFTGELAGFDDKTVTVKMADGKEFVIERDNLALIRLAVTF